MPGRGETDPVAAGPEALGAESDRGDTRAMAGLVEELCELLPGTGKDRVEALLAGLGPRYRDRFPAAEIAAQMRALEALGHERPLSSSVEEAGGGLLCCTVVAYDHPSEFSYIAGALSASGLDILEGDAFTYRPPPGSHGRERAKIVDRFLGRPRPELLGDDPEGTLCARLDEIGLLLEQDGEESRALTGRAVAELAASALELLPAFPDPVLYPVLIETERAGEGLVRMRVESQDTPFFLFLFGAALSLQGLSIERVSIRTRGSRIEDLFEIADSGGSPLEGDARLDDIKLSVLITKQFTSFLGAAADPKGAMLRFETLLAEALSAPDRRMRLDLLSDGGIMADLARLLGASDFLWEDFIRLQYETLLPMLGRGPAGRGFAGPPEELPRILDEALAAASGRQAFVDALNAFKDREILLYDLDHILGLGAGPETLSLRLTALAELVVDRASSFAYRELARRAGEPRTAAGLPAAFAVMGLGKLGGAALGYASDIELLFVYDDSGLTDGPEPIENREFFGELARSVQTLIKARREGIFQVDLRLRPHGNSGPLACSLESFCTYYAPKGPAHSFERLALVRLRAIAGDKALGERVERLRDGLVYGGQGFDLGEFRALRKRQLKEKARHGRPNVKFGSGALVDLEYAVEVLQLERGASEPRLRTPRIDEALLALAELGLVSMPEARGLTEAYDFFRSIINGLRMLRGSAQDLYMPAEGSEEYEHLARRIGYTAKGELSPGRDLRLDFEARTAEVRAFVERRLGSPDRGATEEVNVADLVLSGAGEDMRDAILSAKGFRHPDRALVNLRNIAGIGSEEGDESSPRRLGFARLALMACDILSLRPDPDMALNNWERYVARLPDASAHLSEMLAQPRRLELLLDLFSTSQFLADVLVRKPSLLGDISDSAKGRSRREEEELERELSALSASSRDWAEWSAALRDFRRREILRIGARDFCLGARTTTVMAELSSLADCSIRAALKRLADERAGGSLTGLCVLALGKLGGRELNYSSDVDLLAVRESGGEAEPGDERATSILEGLRSILSDHTEGGYVYRVDLRLRPYGSSGQLVSELAPLIKYYAEDAALWELQALIKARPIAGDLELGDRFLVAIHATLAESRDPASVLSSIDGLRMKSLRQLSRRATGGQDVKTGQGGIREVEFLAQGLQLIHAHANQGLLQSSTLAALSGLAHAGILPERTAATLSEDYLFLRRIEHFLQIYEDRQTHRLPENPDRLQALSRLMLGAEASVNRFMAALELRCDRIHGEYARFIGGHYSEDKTALTT